MTIPIMRAMFSRVKTTKPKTKSNNLLKMEALAKKAKKVANIAKATNEYIPEQAMSTAKFTGCPEALVIKIVGDPYEEDRVMGNPAVLSME